MDNIEINNTKLCLFTLINRAHALKLSKEKKNICV